MFDYVRNGSKHSYHVQLCIPSKADNNHNGQYSNNDPLFFEDALWTTIKLAKQQTDHISLQMPKLHGFGQHRYKLIIYHTSNEQWLVFGSLIIRFNPDQQGSKWDVNKYGTQTIT